MKHRSAGGGRRATTGGTDGRSLESALVASSLLLWLPYSLAAIYIAYCSSFLTEVPVSLSGASAVSAASAGTASSSSSAAASSSAGQGFASSSSSSAFGSSAASVVAMGSVVGATVNAPTAIAAAPHRYSSLYYRIFPADFDIAVFVPLLLRVIPFSVIAVAVTFYLAVYRYNGGEYLMAVAWALGTCSGYGWLTSSTGSVQPIAASSGAARAFLVSSTPPSWLWLAVSLLTGLFSGILCKVKDIVDGKHDRDTHLFPMFDRSQSPAGARGKPSSRQTASADEPLAEETSELGNGSSAAGRRRRRAALRPHSHHLVSLGDRLYMVVPFCTGQWFAFILHHGWRGIVVENGTILLSLGLVGYTMLSYKFLKRQVLRASGRVTRTVAARGRSRRNQRRLEQQQRQQAAATPVQSTDDVSGASTASAEGGPSPTTVAPLSDEDAEDEVSDFFEDVGEVAFIDVIDLISKLFTTSFGVVVLGVVGMNIFMTSLCIPFLKALFKLNALVSGVGIVIELIMYEVA